MFQCCKSQDRTPIAVLKDRLDRKHVPKFQALFNTAYLIAKRNFSFRDFEFLLKLQNKNGLQLGENYQNIQGAKTFIESIAHELRQHTINSLQKCRFFSLMADGSTDRSVAEQESVFVRYVVSGKPVSKFIGERSKIISLKFCLLWTPRPPVSLNYHFRVNPSPPQSYHSLSLSLRCVSTHFMRFIAFLVLFLHNS